MKAFLTAAALTILSGAALAQTAGIAPNPLDPTPMQLVSIDLPDGQPIPEMYINDKYGCEGQNKTPVLSWSYPPDGTKTFAVTLFDVTARDGDGWLHWAVLNIPASESILPTGVGTEAKPLPAGSIVIPNSWGTSGYDGPCPSRGLGKHKYVFTVYALPDDNVQYPLNSIGWSTIDWLRDRSLAHASIETYYERN